MFDHLVGYEPPVESVDDLNASFEPVVRASPKKIVESQEVTSQWLAELGAPDDDELTQQQQREAARGAFGALSTGEPDEKQREALLRIKSPAAFRQLDALLTAYDWEFVERAKELRSYAVTKILQETNHHEARVRLRALELLGKVTEVGLFTERVEVKKVEVGDTELEARIKEKLSKFMLDNGQLEDVQAKPVVEGQDDGKDDGEASA